VLTIIIRSDIHGDVPSTRMTWKPSTILAMGREGLYLGFIASWSNRGMTASGAGASPARRGSRRARFATSLAPIAPPAPGDSRRYPVGRGLLGEICPPSGPAIRRASTFAVKT